MSNLPQVEVVSVYGDQPTQGYGQIDELTLKVPGRRDAFSLENEARPRTITVIEEEESEALFRILRSSTDRLHGVEIDEGEFVASALRASILTGQIGGFSLTKMLYKDSLTGENGTPRLVQRIPYVVGPSQAGLIINRLYPHLEGLPEQSVEFLKAKITGPVLGRLMDIITKGTVKPLDRLAIKHTPGRKGTRYNHE